MGSKGLGPRLLPEPTTPLPPVRLMRRSGTFATDAPKAGHKLVGPQVNDPGWGRIKYVESEPSEKRSFARRAYWRVRGGLAAVGEWLAKTIR